MHDGAAIHLVYKKSNPRMIGDVQRVVVALDYPALPPAQALLSQLDPATCRVKVGKELFSRAGPGFVEYAVRAGFDVFLDLKFHDIPNTVSAACSAAADLGVWMVNVHASGGRRMMMAAAERLAQYRARPHLIAVTVLTSLAEEDLAEIGWVEAPAAQVSRLARLAKDSGLDGVVCSPREAQALRADHGADFLLVTPGVRPHGVATDDQRRVMTPADAIRTGASYLVIGRPITAAADPQARLTAINAEVAAALA